MIGYQRGRCAAGVVDRVHRGALTLRRVEVGLDLEGSLVFRLLSHLQDHYFYTSSGPVGHRVVSWELSLAST